MVVDELIAYLKERMYNQDALFSTLVLDRFFRILSDSKYLFFINADGSFVLSLIFFKMVEALRIKEVDQMIESLQKEIQRPEISSVSIEPVQVEQEKPKVETSIPTQEHGNEENEKEQISEPEPEAVEMPNPSKKMFDELIVNIKDRNSELGECFEKSISFISYENSILTWESCTNEECKKTLTHGYSVIKQLVREVFGFETKIKHRTCTKEIVEKKNDSVENVIEQPIMQEAQSISMVEDAEIGESASCVTNCSSSEDSIKEIDGVNIKDEPMVRKAIELFEATKITIQSKI